MKVSLIATVLNAAGARRRVPRRASRRRRARPTRWSIVDGGSTDGTAERAPRRGEGVTRARGARREHRAGPQPRDRGGRPRRDRGRPTWTACSAPTGSSSCSSRRSRRAPTSRWACTSRSLDASFQRVPGGGEPPARRERGRPATFMPSARQRRVPARRARGRRRLPRVARDRRGHVGEPSVARARPGPAVRSRRGGRWRSACPAATWTPVLPVRARRCAGRHVSRASRATIRRLRGRRRRSRRDAPGRGLAAGALVAYVRTPLRRAWARRAIRATVRSLPSPSPP